MSSLATTHIQIWCLEETHLETNIPPLKLIFVDNGCEGYSRDTHISSKTDLTSFTTYFQIDTSLRHKLFIVFNDIYQNMARYCI